MLCATSLPDAEDRWPRVTQVCACGTFVTTHSIGWCHARSSVLHCIVLTMPCLDCVPTAWSRSWRMWCATCHVTSWNSATSPWHLKKRCRSVRVPLPPARVSLWSCLLGEGALSTLLDCMTNVLLVPVCVSVVGSCVPVGCSAIGMTPLNTLFVFLSRRFDEQATYDWLPALYASCSRYMLRSWSFPPNASS